MIRKIIATSCFDGTVAYYVAGDLALIWLRNGENNGEIGGFLGLVLNYTVEATY